MFTCMYVYMDPYMRRYLGMVIPTVQPFARTSGRVHTSQKTWPAWVQALIIVRKYQGHYAFQRRQFFVLQKAAFQ